jgi:hypothetical protein
LNFFYNVVPPEGVLSLEELHLIVCDIWLRRHDEELELERAARRKGRPKSTREQKLEETKLREEEVYRTGLGESPNAIAGVVLNSRAARDPGPDARSERSTIPRVGPEGGWVSTALAFHTNIQNRPGCSYSFSSWNAPDAAIKTRQILFDAFLRSWHYYRGGTCRGRYVGVEYPPTFSNSRDGHWWMSRG